MLHAHPEVFVLDEGWFLNDRGASVEAWLDTEAFGRWAGLEHNGWLRAIPRAEAELIARRAMMEALMREAAARAQRRTRITRIGDKTTFYYNDRPEALHALFPRSRYISVVRDGRDVAVSHAFYQFKYRRREGPGIFSMFSPEGRAHMERAYAYYTSEERERQGDPVPLFTEETLRYFAGVWKHTVAGARRAAALWGEGTDGGRFHEIRYERLHAKPELIGETLRFLGVAADGALVRQIVECHAFERRTGGRKPGQEAATAYHRKGIVGDWRNYFTPRDQKVFWDAAGEELRGLGYERD